MKLTFLCTNCRNWFESNPSEVPSRCHGSYMWGLSEYREGKLDKALQGVGSSFEMSEIMLRSDSLCNSYASDWLVETSKTLVRILNELGRTEDSVEIHRKTSVLISESNDNEDIKRLTPTLARIARDAYGSKDYLSLVH